MVVVEHRPDRGTPEIRLSQAALDLEGEPDPRVRRWIKRALIAVGSLACVGLLSVFLLAFADFTIAGNGSQDFGERVRWTWDRGDHLHYGVHLVAGRILDLCPCTRRAADAQYYYARFHAVTPRQQAVLKSSRPGSLAGIGEYIVGPFGVGLDWIGDGIAWLRGSRPASTVVVDLDEFAMNPREIHVLRGTTVVWRNVDQLGEAHTVTADPGQLVKFDSDFLEPDERYAFVFTERGRFAYYCQAHGEPGLKGMAGLVVVD